MFDGGVILDETIVRNDQNQDILLPANATSIYGTAFLGEDIGQVTA